MNDYNRFFPSKLFSPRPIDRCLALLPFRLNVELGSFVYPSLMLEKSDACLQPGDSVQNLPGAFSLGGAEMDTVA